MISTILVLGIFFQITGSGQAGMAEKPTLESLQGLGQFQIKVTGKPLKSFPSRRDCVYFEWDYGEKDENDELTSYSVGYKSQDPVIIITTKGMIEVPINKIRLYIGPSFTKTYSREESSISPKPVRERLIKEENPITLEEYTLRQGRNYYATIKIESYNLPPRPGEGKPSEHYNAVLQLSDVPFLEGKPQRKLTPAFRGFTY